MRSSKQGRRLWNAPFSCSHPLDPTLIREDEICDLMSGMWCSWRHQRIRFAALTREFSRDKRLIDKVESGGPQSDITFHAFAPTSDGVVYFQISTDRG